MKLVIVESPTKARKLTSYLGSGFVIKASVGHVRDLPKSKLGVDVEGDFEPTYAVSKDKSKVIKELREQAAKADSIILATDPDREGEAIAWHIKYLLQEAKAKGVADIKEKPMYRATFHEITKPAVQAAIEKPTQINQDLVDAQQARRVVDRLVGYQISPVLWKKIRRGLSAGRVQSVALRLIVEREREIEAFKPDEYWEVDVALNPEELGQREVFAENGQLEDIAPTNTFSARVVEIGSEKYEPTTEKHVTPVVKDLKQAAYTVAEVEKKERRRSSPPPFTTSTLQQRAATTLGMTSKQTMRLAQQLYEEGLITYHRTDSFSLSQAALSMARSYISEVLGDKYLPEKPRVFRSSSKNAQEAHEAIRVTNVKVTGDQVAAKAAKLTGRHAQLYDLIWRRFVASQMTPAVYDQTTILVEAKPTQASPHQARYLLRTSGSILKFDGWLKYSKTSDDTMLPDVQKDQPLYFLQESALQKFTQPPPRYNDASLVKELEKRGIGRPSTYASIISVIEDRGYVERQDKRFSPTAIGTTVNDFLVEHFQQIMDYDFTAQMEDDLDEIASGKKEWKQIIKTFYKPLEKTIEHVEEHAERAKIPVESTGETCPKCGDEHQGEVVIRTGRYGKFLSCNRYPECDYTDKLIQTVPDVKCPLCQKGDVVIKNTRWGRQFFGCGQYPDCDWASWKQPEPGTTITAAEWAEQQAARKARQAKRAKGKKKTSKAKKTTKKKTTKKATKKKTAAKKK